MNEWLKIAVEREIAKTGIQVAIVVGTILVAINYFDNIIEGELFLTDYFKIAITYSVPYFVSTYSCIRLRLREQTLS